MTLLAQSGRARRRDVLAARAEAHRVVSMLVRMAQKFERPGRRRS